MRVDSTLADPTEGLAVTTYAWEITDALVTAAAAPAVDSPCPTATREVPNGATTVVICGLNLTTDPATPAHGTLGARWSPDPVRTLPVMSLHHRCRACWEAGAEFSFNQSADLATIAARVSSAPTATSPVMVLTGYSNPPPPINESPAATSLSAAETYTEDTTRNLIDIVVSESTAPR